MLTKYALYYNHPPNNVTNYQQMMNDLMSIVHTALLALKITNPNRNLVNKLCDVTSFHRKKFQLDPEVLNMISAMALTFGKAFGERLD